MSQRRKERGLAEPDAPTIAQTLLLQLPEEYPEGLSHHTPVALPDFLEDAFGFRSECQ
jgi:hypothetical protein